MNTLIKWNANNFNAGQVINLTIIIFSDKFNATNYLNINFSSFVFDLFQVTTPLKQWKIL